MKSLYFYCLLLVSLLSFSQNSYKFIPEDQQLVSDNDLKTIQIVITPDVLLFNEQGKILPQSNISLMANPEYKPLFYATQGTIKSVVFKKKSNQPVLVSKNPEAEYKKGEKAYDFIVRDLQGQTIKLSELKGKVVVLNFWFTKCPPCVKEMPLLNELVADYRSKDVVFLAITFNKKDVVQRFLKDTEFNFKIAANANDVVTMYGVQSYPTSIVINKEGNIVLKEVGYRTNIKSVITKAINPLLK